MQAAAAVIGRGAPGQRPPGRPPPARAAGTASEVIVARDAPDLIPSETVVGRQLRTIVGGTAATAIALGLATSAAADTSRMGKEGLRLQARHPLRGKNKLCCGYALVPDLAWALRFYWLAREEDFDDPEEIDYADVDETDIYNRRGFYVGTFSKEFIWHLRMEGSGLLADGRVVNYSGACKYGTGTCFEQLDAREFPFGRGARRRTLTPFKSVAVDPRLIPLGEPLYIPEFDGMRLPDGSVHDGCVRADDTGGGIKLRKMDFFVVTYGNFRTLLQELWGTNWVTPVIQAPRCEYLRDT